MLLAALIPVLCATAARQPQGYRAVGTIVLGRGPYLAGSRIPLRVDGFSPPYRIAVLGEGSVTDAGSYVVGASARSAATMLVAGNGDGLAARSVRIAQPPPPGEALLAVAAYDDGIVFHDARTFAVRGILGTGGTPGDVAIDATGCVAAPDTQGSSLALATLAPWRVTQADGVALGDEVAFDGATIFVTNRELDGRGGLTRVAPDGSIVNVATGLTAEGLAVDARRHVVYVANVNDGTVAVVDARSMQVIRRFYAIARVFSLALSPDGRRLFAISNQSAASPFAAPGAAIAIDLRHDPPRIVARSRELTFPIGAALDAAGATLFVTDEARDVVYVLDARTLAAKHAPLLTCRTPWKPELDAAGRRLYVPCARDDRVDVFNLRSLQRVEGAPFATGGYPLAVAVWHGRPASNLRPGR